MSERLRESLSALMDDEADDLELGRILRAMDQDGSELRSAWGRYQLVSAVMRGEAGAGAFPPLALDLMAESATSPGQDPATEAAERVQEAGAPRRSWRGLTSFAVAASITAVAVVGWQQWPAGTVPDGSVEVAETRSSPSPVRTPDRRALVPATQTRLEVVPLEAPRVATRARVPSVQPSADEQIRQQLEAYMVRHAEHNALNSRSGMVPFARMAAFDGAQ